MSEAKNTEEIAVIANKSSMWMTVAKAIIICLLVIFVLIAGFVTYLQLATFEEIQPTKTVGELLVESKENLVYSKDGFVIDVPEEVLSTEVTRRLKESLVDTSFDVEKLCYDVNTRTFRMNLTYSGFYLPIAIQTNFISHNQVINLVPESVKLGNKQIALFFPVKSWLLNSKFMEVFSTTTLEPMGRIENTYVSLSQTSVSDGVFVLKYKLDEDMIRLRFDALKLELDEALVEAYKSSDDLKARKAAEMLTQVYPLSDEQIVEIVNDILGNQILTRHLLVLAGDKATFEMAGFLGDNGVPLDTSQIELDRKLLEGQGMNEICDEILMSLDTYFTDIFVAFNQGKPFDIGKLDTITVKDLIELDGLEVDPSLSDRLTFIIRESVGVAYQIDDNTYYIKYHDSYELLDKANFDKIKGSGAYSEAKLVDDLALWNEISAPIETYFDVDNIFIRYMKSDGKSAFVIASPEDDPQQFWTFALMKDSTFVIIDDKVRAIYDLFEAHPEFNLETATYASEDYRVVKVSDDNKEFIMERLYQNGTISNRSDYEIVYSSYDGNYIYFKLSDEREFVYKVEGTNLTSLYTKEKANTNWPDISIIITLQDMPTE